MNKERSIPWLGMIGVIGLVVTAYVLNVELLALRRENAALKAELGDQRPIPRTGEIPSDTSPAIASRGMEENRDFQQRIDQLTSELAEVKKGHAALESELEELLRPAREDILSSTLKTHVKEGEVLVTGGYQTADGAYHFAMVEPKAEVLEDGSTAIRLRTFQYSVTSEVMGELGLDSLRTSAGNTLQHGEVWTAEELNGIRGRMSRTQGAQNLSNPQIVLRPGQSGELHFGDYRWRTTPSFSENAEGFDLTLRFEQPRVPQSTVNEDGG